MKTEFLEAVVALAALCAAGQGALTYQYDQQSSTQEFSLPYGSGPSIQSLFPTGQGFTPTLSGVDFIKVKFQDGDPNDGLGAMINLILHSGSFTGPVLGTTASVDLPNGFTGVASFFFPNTVPLTPGALYYFELNLQSTGVWNVDFEGFNYLGGDSWVRGHDDPAGGYWFREGIIVPEPSSAALLLLGGAAFACLRLVRHK
jgi:hypothetical protein